MSIRSLIASGTKVWLDSIEPKLVESNRRLGASGHQRPDDAEHRASERGVIAWDA